MKNIISYKLFSNNNEKSLNIAKIVNNKLIENGFINKDSNYDLALAIGGDGSFIRMVNNNHFSSDTLYVGVNAGTLGFAQEVAIEELDDFILELKNKTYKVDNIGIQETSIYTKDGKYDYNSLNEVVIRQENLNTLLLKVYIEDSMLEEFSGDGLLISTSFGSTAYNLSLGGSIVYNTFHTLQITPIAPISNKSYRNLNGSVILPDNMKVTLEPSRSKDLLVIVDGEIKKYSDVDKIETTFKNKRIRCIRRKDYNFAKKINEKFLK